MAYKGKCGTKRRWRDKQEVDRALKWFASKSVRDTIPQRAYFCESCRGFHVSSRPDYYA
jgi:hypothetical protein